MNKRFLRLLFHGYKGIIHNGYAKHKYLPISIDLGISSTRPLGTYKKFDNTDFINGLRQTIEDYCNNYHSIHNCKRDYRTCEFLKNRHSRNNHRSNY